LIVGFAAFETWEISFIEEKYSLFCSRETGRRKLAKYMNQNCKTVEHQTL
jgi:hypothetical protein